MREINKFVWKTRVRPLKVVKEFYIWRDTTALRAKLRGRAKQKRATCL